MFILFIAALIFAVVSGLAVPCTAQAPSPGLVAAYAFNEGAGTTVADSSGNSNTGTIGGATWTTAGRFGNALLFSGSGFVTIPDAPSLDLTTGMTLEAWVYPTATPTGWTTAIMKEQPSQFVYLLAPGSPTNRPHVFFNAGTSSSTERPLAGPAALPLNTWSHLTGTYDGATLRLYVNGTLVASRAFTGPIRTSTGALRIGGNSIWGEYFRGRIDEVRIYNRARTSTEIQTDMNSAVEGGPPPPPPPPLSQVGQWSSPFAWPIVAVHMTLLRTGKVLAWDNYTDQQGTQLWNPVTDTFASVPNNFGNFFCSGHVSLPDGRTLVGGGHNGTHTGIPRVSLFDPTTQSWASAQSMSVARWYPTVTGLPDGRVLVLAGETHCNECNAEIPEIYDPRTNTWSQLPNARLNLPYYPYIFVLPDGRVLSAGSHRRPILASVLDLTTGAWTTVDPVAADGGSSAMYLPGKILQSGTARDVDLASQASGASTYVLDMTQPSPAWRQTAPMAFARTQHNLTLLPDGTVLATGGGRTSDVYDLGSAVHEAELWSPTTETWTTLASMEVPRLYHSTALLLPDGRVLLAGGGRYGVNQFSAELYSPPYLFKGARPTITSAPATIQHGTTFSITTPDASRIAAVSLVRLGSVTHAFNQDQRFVPLTFQQISGGLNVQAPANGNLAPPGYYMLFILDTNGVPSVAAFVRFPSPWEDMEPPTPPSNLTANGSVGTVNSSWTAATDNVGVTAYNVHRSTSPGVVPTVANRIAQTSSSSYTDGGLAPGTYFYVVTAQDAAGNVSPPSNEASATATADTAPPTAPSNLTATASSPTQINLAWTAATDNVGVTGYRVERCQGTGCSTFAQVATPTGTTYNDPGRLAATSYSYRVSATDAAGNPSPYSNTASATTPAATSGLVAAYAFNEGAGTTVGDTSGNNNTGTIGGATWTTAGRFGNALLFTGSGFVTIPHAASLNLTTGMTLEAWVYPTATPTGWTTAIMKEQPGQLVYLLTPGSPTNRPHVFFNAGTSSSTERSIAGPAALPLNTWSHLAGTYDGATLRLYVNGALVASRAFTGPIRTSTGALRIGGNSIWGEYFRGRLDEVRIYNRARTLTEIQTDMNSAVGGAPPP